MAPTTASLRDNTIARRAWLTYSPTSPTPEVAVYSAGGETFRDGACRPTFPGYRSFLVAILRPGSSAATKFNRSRLVTAKTARCSAPLGRNSLLYVDQGVPLPSSAVASDLISRSRWCGRRPKLGDQHQGFLEPLSRHRDLGHLEGRVAAVAHDIGAIGRHCCGCRRGSAMGRTSPFRGAGGKVRDQRSGGHLIICRYGATQFLANAAWYRASCASPRVRQISLRRRTRSYPRHRLSSVRMFFA